MIADEPEDSAVLSCNAPGAHRVEGLGAGFVPDYIDTSLVDEFISIPNDTAFRPARNVARIKSISVGVSSGAAIAASLEILERPDRADKRIVIVTPAFAEHYLPKLPFEGD